MSDAVRQSLVSLFRVQASGFRVQEWELPAFPNPQPRTPFPPADVRPSVPVCS